VELEVEVEMEVEAEMGVGVVLDIFFLFFNAWGNEKELRDVSLAYIFGQSQIAAISTV
jgi:hypothetical protein